MTVCGRIDLRRTWPTATGGRLSAPWVPLLRAISRSFALIMPAAKPVGSQHSAHGAPAIALHAAGCRPSLARGRAGAHGTGKDQGQPLDIAKFRSRNAANSSEDTEAPAGIPSEQGNFRDLTGNVVPRKSRPTVGFTA